MRHIVSLVPRPGGPPQDATCAGLHPTIAPLRLAEPDPQLEAALVAGAEKAAARGPRAVIIVVVHN